MNQLKNKIRKNLEMKNTFMFFFQCITKAMQFKKFKFHHLDGKDVQSMLSLLKNKETYKENLNNIVYESGESWRGSH